MEIIEESNTEEAGRAKGLSLQLTDFSMSELPLEGSNTLLQAVDVTLENRNTAVAPGLTKFLKDLPTPEAFKTIFGKVTLKAADKTSEPTRSAFPLFATFAKKMSTV